jgi:uncharacterized DUF497 family protein
MHECTYTVLVAQWDPEKAATNLRKHGVDFADAETALRDEMALTMADDGSEAERFVTLGMDAMGRLLVVVYEWRDEDVRLISARKATRTSDENTRESDEEKLRLHEGKAGGRTADTAWQDADYDSYRR